MNILKFAKKTWVCEAKFQFIIVGILAIVILNEKLEISLSLFLHLCIPGQVSMWPVREASVKLWPVS